MPMTPIEKVRQVSSTKMRFDQESLRALRTVEVRNWRVGYAFCVVRYFRLAGQVMNQRNWKGLSKVSKRKVMWMD